MSDEGRLAVATHLVGSGQPQRALESLEAAGPAALTSEGLTVRARALLLLDRAGEAAAAARRGLSAEPDDVPLLSLLAVALSRLDDLAGAEQAVLQALRHDPQHAVLLRQYAWLLDLAGQLDKAERVLARAAALDPGSPHTARLRAEIATSRGHDRAALRHARAAMALDPADTAVRATAGYAAANNGQAATAARNLSYVASQELGNRDLRDTARTAVIAAHPALRPLAALSRLGPAGVWAIGVTVVLLANLLLPDPFGLVALLLWLGFCAYSWIAPPLVGAWVRWRRSW